ncbi:hypothetical protein IHE45_12G071600 [Dioscorea alata]|uniref:Uncharacterized protein n=3 Tax=Dioscorea alata TaxID=55571 RepID=A0ACB7V3B0_DIOAL|nr:hypothetical protein IHE45_12G071600 [Dioscorea alata]KAH7667620.1 hypothetical protein IHE45_12G071600 [Dioscorea alata]KAH7667622.1 hypothetical protein IHE45_12G071600 [Dioscorea alata]
MLYQEHFFLLQHHHLLMFLDIHWLRNATMLHMRLSVNMPVLSQTRQQEIRNSEIIAEAKHIMESRMFNKVEEVDVPVDTINIETTEKIATQAESISPSSDAQPSPSAVAPPTIGAGSTSTPASLHMVHLYLRTHVLDQMIQAASSTAGLRTIKRVDQTLQDLGLCEVRGWLWRL